MSGFTAVLLDGKTLVKSITTDLETVEGNFYFLETGLVDRSKFTESDTHTHCGWKGDASYYNYKDESGKEYKDIAWYYPTPMKGAEKVANRVAFNLRKYSELKIGEPAREDLEDQAFKLGDKIQ